MKKVVIIGGGYSGLAMVESLMYIDDIEIILIDKNNYQYQPKNIYRYISGDTEFSTIFRDLLPHLQKLPREITFIHDEVCLVDTEGKKLKCKNSKEITFDYLVICAGAETDFLQFDDNLTIDNSQLTALIDKSKQENFFLFGKPAVKIQDGTPAEPAQKGLKDLTANELKQLRLELAKKASR